MQLCGFEVGLNRPFILLAGPCVIESEQLTLDIAGKCCRRKIEVVPLDTVITGIVLGSDEPGRVGNVQSALRQPASPDPSATHGFRRAGVAASGKGACPRGG